MKKLFLLSISALVLLAGCQRTATTPTEVEVVNLTDVIEVGDLTEIATDFVVVPLKYDGPIDAIEGIKFFDNKAFGRNKDSRKIYCFNDYELYAILDRLGRGPGEYTYISDFTYNMKTNTLYIPNDTVIWCYDATTMDYIGKREVNFDIQNMQVFGDKVLYNGIPGFEKTRMNYSVILADIEQNDLSDAVVLSRHHLLHEYIYGSPQVFYINPMNRSYSRTGFVNSIVTFDDDSITTIYNFRFGDIDVPKSYIATDYSQYENDITSFIINWYSEMSDIPAPCEIFNIIVDGKTISFRYDYYPEGTGGRTDELYWVKNKKGTNVYHKLRVPGITLDIEPIGCHDNRNVAILDNYREDCIDDSTEMSPLGKQIIEAMKSQNDDNPVLIEFRFK